MSKKTIFMGGVALLLITFLVLIGCHGAGTPIPPKPSFSLTGVTLGPDTLTVVFSDTLANIDKTQKTPNYTTTATNYTVTKIRSAVKETITGATASKGADDKTVVLTITDLQDQLMGGDSLVVTLAGANSKPYAVEAPNPSGGEANAGSKITITFSKDVMIKGSLQPAQFAVTGSGVTFTVSKATVATGNSNAIELEDSGATGLVKGATDVSIKYTPDKDNKITGQDGIAVAPFDQAIDTSKLP